MPSNNNEMACRVCGLIQLSPPWGEDGKTPNYEFCSCCGVEFGYQDSSIYGVINHRRKWLDSGANWNEPDNRPENWTVEEQLKDIPSDYVNKD